MEKRIYIEMNGKWKKTYFATDYNDFLGIKRRILIQMSLIDFCKNSAHPYTKTATM